jgi:4-oxalomesaconate tautomerase
MQTSIRCLFMSGGTSRGLFFRESDPLADTTICGRVLLAAMGSLRHGNST